MLTGRPKFLIRSSDAGGFNPFGGGFGAQQPPVQPAMNPFAFMQQFQQQQQQQQQAQGGTGARTLCHSLHTHAYPRL